MIPIFPQFKKLELFDKPEILNFTLPYLPYSDYNLTSLLSWNTENKTQISQLNKNLVVEIDDYVSHKSTLCFFGKSKVSDTLKKIFQYKKNISIHLVPEFCITDRLLSHFSIVEDRDNFDYIYATDELSQCAGKKYETLRNQVNRFTKKYDSITEIKKVDLLDKNTRKEILDLVELWNSSKKSNEKTELRAIENFINYADHALMVNIGIYINDNLVAFCLSEPQTQNYMLSHFAKADTQYSGIYAKLMIETAKAIHKIGFKFLNYEQDLGIESLRYAKMQFRPHHFLKKYKITQNTTQEQYAQLSFPKFTYEPSVY